MNDESLMPFGQHKGIKLGNVPAGYLIWLLENKKLFGDLKKYVEDNEDVLREEIRQQNINNKYYDN